MNETRTSILIVEDDASIVHVLKTHLVTFGYDVSTTSTAKATIQLVAQNAPTLIILDLGLPDGDGKEVIKTLRHVTDTPIIVLTARHEEDERVDALDLGADDYVTKPFRMKELQARVRAALRRSTERGKAPKKFYSRGLEIDFEQRTVKLSGETMHLTRKEYDLLVCLAHHAGQVVTHKQLLAAGWGGTQVDTQFVRAAIGQLRQKVEANPAAPVRILTEQGVGYRLKVEI